MRCEWRQVQEFPDYQVSDQGDVRRVIDGRIKKRSQRDSGELLVNLRSNGKSYVRSVHILVADAFIGKRQPNQVVRFADGNKANCRLANLSYAPRREAVPSEPFPQGKLTVEDVARIRVLLRHEVPGKVIAEAFGVSGTAISLIKQGKKWRR